MENRRSVWVVGRWVLVVLMGAGVAGWAEEKKPAATVVVAPSRWVQIEAAMGAMNVDGTLRRRFSLGESAELKALGAEAGDRASD